MIIRSSDLSISNPTKFILLLGWILVFFLGGCESSPAENLPANPVIGTIPEGGSDQDALALPLPMTAEPLPTDISTLSASALTYQNPDGNRWVQGQGELPELTPFELRLSGTPVWVVGGSIEEEILWVVALADGRVEAFQGIGRNYRKVDFTPDHMEVGKPLSLWTIRVRLQIPAVQSQRESVRSHPIYLPLSGITAFINPAGDLVFEDFSGEVVGQLPANALLDARILRDEKDRLLVLSSPTDRYAHGVLGDKIEAAGLTLVETQPHPRIITQIDIPNPHVIEGLSPLWFDINGDGEREIIVTISNAEQGAQFQVFDETGLLVASSQAIGKGFRWRHQLAVAPLGPNGELELVSILTPHLGGVVEFHQLHADRLIRVAAIPGYSSHALGSPNLDMAAVGDFDGDGQLEVLVPNQQKTGLGAIKRTPEGAITAWILPLSARLATNLAVAQNSRGRLVLAVGQQDNTLRLWVSDE